MRGWIAVLFAALVMLTGCGGEPPEETVVQTTQATLPQIQVMETIGVYDEYPGMERKFLQEPEIWYAPYPEEAQLQLRCLVRNDTDGALNVDSLQVSFYRDGDMISQESYGPPLIQKFMRPADSSLTLTPGDSTLLKVTDEMTRDVFQEAVCQVTLSDGVGEAQVQTFRFTTDEDKVTPLPMTWEGGWEPVTMGEESWVFYSQLNNDTDAILYLEAMHIIFYQDGIPVNTNSFSAQALSGMHTAQMAELSPGESYTYSDAHPVDNTYFDQREVTFLYRYAQGQPYTMTFRFRLEQEEALRETDEAGGVSVLYDVTKLPQALGRAEYTSQEIRKMITDQLTLEQVAEKIHTVADLLQYLHESRFGMASGDISFEDGGIQWHVNASPHSAFYGNQGNTGGSGNLVNYILRGDYEEQGYFVEVTHRGAHIHSYVKQDGVYYFLDLPESMRDEIYDITCFRMVAAESLEAYGALRLEQNHALYQPGENFYTVMQYLYPWEGSHRPLGLKDTFTILPEELRDRVIFLYTEPDYPPEFARTPPESIWPPVAK